MQKRSLYRKKTVVVAENKPESEEEDEGGASDDDCGGDSDEGSCESIEEQVRKKDSPRPMQVDLPHDQEDDMQEIKDSQDNWDDFKQYCVDIAANNLSYLMQLGAEEITTKVDPELV